MRSVILILFCAVLWFMPPLSMAQSGADTSAKTTQTSSTKKKAKKGTGVLRCMRGVGVCAPFANDREKYESCMITECTRQPDAQLMEPVEAAKKREICNAGLAHCAPLRNEEITYWDCMQQTCLEPEKFPEQPCDKASKSCESTLKTYYSCLSSTCPGYQPGTRPCEKGEATCKIQNNLYWDCISTACYGDAITARNAILDQMTYTRKDGTRIPRPHLEGVHPNWRHAPDGVDAMDWASSIPPWRRLRGNPINQLQCINRKGTFIHCRTNDIISCYCSDGSAALPR